MKVIVLSVFLAICFLATTTSGAGLEAGECQMSPVAPGRAALENDTGEEVLAVQSEARACYIESCRVRCRGFYWAMCCKGTCYCLCRR